MKKIAIDMDGTICEQMPTFQRCLAGINEGAKEVINDLYKDNHIIIFTSRGWAEYEMTKDWLDKNEIKYHQLICGKPIYDMIIDDKGEKYENWNKIMEILGRPLPVKE